MADEPKKVVVLQSDEDFGGVPETLVGKEKKKKKKQQVALKPVEKVAFKAAKRLDEASKVYRDAHEKSNSKKKDGWLRDLPKNYTKAMSKLMKF